MLEETKTIIGWAGERAAQAALIPSELSGGSVSGVSGVQNNWLVAGTARWSKR